MSQKWKITFSFSTGPIPAGLEVYVTTETNTSRPTEKEIKEALKALGIETENPWVGISGSYKVDLA